MCLSLWLQATAAKEAMATGGPKWMVYCMGESVFLDDLGVPPFYIHIYTVCIYIYMEYMCICVYPISTYSVYVYTPYIYTYIYTLYIDVHVAILYKIKLMPTPRLPWLGIVKNTRHVSDLADGLSWGLPHYIYIYRRVVAVQYIHAYICIHIHTLWIQVPSEALGYNFGG